MKKLSVLLAAVVLSFSLSQCAKEGSPATQEPRKVEMKEISITAGYSTKAEASALNHVMSFKWKATDSICVYGAAGYCGAIRLKEGAGTNSGYFSGEVDLGDAGSTLTFIHYGSAIKPASDGSVELLLNEQNGSLSFVSDHIVARSTVTYEGQEHFTTSLTVQFAVANFKLDHSLFSFAPSEVEMVGVTNNKLSVSSLGEITYSTSTCTILKSIIPSSSVYYIIMLPESNVGDIDFVNVEHELVRRAFNRDVEVNKYYYGTAPGDAIQSGKNYLFPFLETSAVTCITNNVASSGGYINSQGTDYRVNQRGVCWSVSENPSLRSCGDSCTTNYMYEEGKYAEKTYCGSFTSFITSLKPNTTYHVRAYATNSYGTSYGKDTTFTTSAFAPEVNCVDLGTSAPWADRNLGAASPADTGAYYMWADRAGIASRSIIQPAKEQVTYLYNHQNSYRFFKYVTSMFAADYGYDGKYDDLTVIELEDDAAAQTLGDGWRIPTTTDWIELRNQCYWLWNNTPAGYYVFKAKNAADQGKITNAVSSYSPAVAYDKATDANIFLPSLGLMKKSSTPQEPGTLSYITSDLYGYPSHYTYVFANDSLTTLKLGAYDRLNTALPIRPIYIGSATNHGANEKYGYSEFKW